MAPIDTTIDQEKLRQLMAGGPNVPQIAPPLSDAPASPQLPALNFKQRQALPTTSQGVAPGSSAFYGNKLERIEDQQAHADAPATSTLGKVGQGLRKIGNIAGDVTGATWNVPGTEANRQIQERQLGQEQNRAQQVETQGKQQAATEAYQTGELADRATGRKIEQQKQDFEENKPGTPEQEAVRDLTQRNNPETNQPYTPEEAAVKYARDIAQAKPDKAETPHTITMVGPDKKPYEYQFDDKGNYTDPNQGYGQWKKVGPAKPEANGGLIGSLTPLLGPNGQLMGTMNTKTGEIKPITNNPLTSGTTPAATTGTGARLSHTEANQFATQYINPANDMEQQYQKAQAAVQAYNSNPQTGAAGMVLLASHLGTTLGSVKGATTGEHMVTEHQNAIGLGDRMQRYIDYLKTGQPLSAGQIQEFNNLITETRNISWDVAAKEAARRHQPIDFLPSDMQINMKDSAGKARKVPGSRVQQALDAGAEIQ